MTASEFNDIFGDRIELTAERRDHRMAKGISFYYDKEGDVLDISVDETREAISEEISEDFFVRKDPKTNEIVGFMILNFGNRFQKLVRLVGRRRININKKMTGWPLLRSIKSFHNGFQLSGRQPFVKEG